MIHFRALLLVLIIFAGLTISTIAQDDGNVGGDGFSVHILDAGETIEGAFTADRPGRLYAFNGTAGDTVRITMTDTNGFSSDGMDVLLVLLGSAGEVLAVSGDFDGDERAAFIEAELPRSGGYLLFATTFVAIRSDIDDTFDRDRMTYQLTLRGNTPPTDLDGFDPATVQYQRGEISIGEMLEGYSILDEPVFFAVFNGEAGQVVDITMDSGEIDTIFHVFMDGGVRVGFNDDDFEQDTINSAQRGFELPQTGEYIIMATHLGVFEAIYFEDDELKQEGTFTLTVIEADE